MCRIPVIILSLFFTSCQPSTEDDPAHSYEFSSPDKVYELPDVLREISGIAYLSGSHLACIQDEMGAIFIFDTGADKIERSIEVLEEGDYEDIAVSENDIYIIRSDGSLFHIADLLHDVEVKEIPTMLTAEQNIEGLFYFKSNSTLLIACKGHAISGMVGKKVVYEFDLASGSLRDTPFLIIDIEELKSRMSSGLLWDLAVKIEELFITRNYFFQPSAIAVHPVTNEIFVLSDTNSLLLILDEKKKLNSIVSLEQSIFPQPEGLTFAPTGDLYISNEGKGRKGSIVKMEFKDEQ